MPTPSQGPSFSTAAVSRFLKSLTRLRLPWMALAWLAAASFVEGGTGPALSIVATNNAFLLHWSTNDATSIFSLQSSADLAQWVAETNTAPATYGADAAVMVSSGSNAQFFRLIAIGSVTPAGMAAIPAGSFTIGDTLDGEGDATPTNVSLSRFFIETNLVSSNVWAAVYAQALGQGYGFDFAGRGKGAAHPVQTVNWYDCVKWCNARSQQQGLTPVYYTDAGLSQVYTKGDTDAVFVNWSANGFRLPTEAEWECASRGGLSGQRFPWGDTISWNQANYFGNPGAYSYDDAAGVDFDPAYATGGYPYTSPVGALPANGYGLYDMAGNVLEWCWDWYGGPPYSAGSPYLGGSDPHGPVSSSSGLRAQRGGDWSDNASYARCANRNFGSPGNASDNIGFRCVRGF